MDYYKINYKKLANMQQIKYYVFIMIFASLITVLIIISCIRYTYNTELFYGVYNDNILSFKINAKLSDKIKKQHKLLFNNKEVNYKILEFNNHEIIDNEVYEIVEVELDGKFYQNEVGEVKINFDRKKIILYILDLFK